MKDTEVNKTIGRNIRIRRCLKGYSQSVLADRLRVTFQQVQKYENGSNAISPVKLVELSALLDCPIQDFFSDAAVSEQDEQIVDYIPSRKAVHLVGNFEGIQCEEVRNRICDFVRAIAKGGY